MIRHTLRALTEPEIHYCFFFYSKGTWHEYSQSFMSKLFKYIYIQRREFFFPTKMKLKGTSAWKRPWNMTKLQGASFFPPATTNKWISLRSLNEQDRSRDYRSWEIIFGCWKELFVCSEKPYWAAWSHLHTDYQVLTWEFKSFPSALVIQHITSLYLFTINEYCFCRLTIDYTRHGAKKCLIFTSAAVST